VTGVQVSILEPILGGRHSEERFALADLLAADGIDPDGSAWAAEAAIRFGVCHRTVHRWRHLGLTLVQADRAAIGAGLHPAIVWQAWTR
jgi:hypothetical protein